MRTDLNEALAVNDEVTVTAATKILQNWNKAKKLLAPKKDKKNSTTFSNYVNTISQPKVIIHNNIVSSTSSITVVPKKRSIEYSDDVSSSGNGTWESLAKQKTKKKESI